MQNSTLAITPQRLCPNHGYRFDGDFVHLNAELSFSEADLAAGEVWSLQLWASRKGFRGGVLAGVKVAELPVQAQPGRVLAAGRCAAFPPAGGDAQVLAMALVAYGSDGIPVLRDLASYPATETFRQPCFVGKVTCEVANEQAHIGAESIANPRAANALSGTLALEVWALDAPYGGGSWQGDLVASVVLGVTGGGCESPAYQLHVPATMPAGCAALTLMLREWTPAGYVTRDYRNFPGVPGASGELAADKPELASGANLVAAPLLADSAAPAKVALVAERKKLVPNLKKQLPARKKGATAHKAAHKPAHKSGSAKKH